jgi:type VI secretion system secreted protein VgrG
MAFQQTERYFSIATPLGADKLLLRSFYGEELLSGLFHFSLEMDSEDPSLDFTRLVGKAVTITVKLADGGQRYLNGVVGRFVQAGRDLRFARYRAEVYPWLWLLTLGRDCRIFQQKSVPDIVSQVFSDLGMSDYKNSLVGSYPPREYCVQYNETHFDFVSRLLEEEGISYFFEHADGKHTLVLADDPSALATCSGAETVKYGTYEQWVQQTIVPQCSLEENVIAGAVALDDFSFETPSTDFIVEAASTAAQNGGKRRLYEYPGGFLKKDAGEGLTTVRIEEQEAPLRLLRGDSYTPAFTAGGRFTLAEHYRDDVNAEYALVRVAHRGEGESYVNSFDAIPAAVKYRPPRTTKKPRIAGAQTAIVVGKSGEEIWTDKYGRVKVQFHWDQVGKNDENSSCWIRVAHGWAGKGWGQISLPRIGQEVVVSFEEGDPDRPLITGRVYNAEQTVPYALPDEGTKSTIKSDTSKGGGGYNELRFEDKKDSEEVYFQAEKDFNRVVKNNDTLKVGFQKKDAGDQTIDVYNDRTVTIEEGSDSLTVKKGDRTIKVETGKESHEVKDTRTLTITGAETHDDKDDFDHNVDKDYTLKVKGNLLIDVTGDVTIKAGKSLTIQSGQAMTQKAGTSLLAQAGADLTNKAGTSLTNQSGTDLTNKAGTSLTNDAGISLTSKASSSQTVDGGGMLTLKGGVVKIN